MTLHEDEALLQRIHAQWRTLITAEQQGASIRELEHLYADYDRLLETCKDNAESEHDENREKQAPQSSPDTGKKRAPAKTAKERKGRKNWKMAS